MKNKIGFFAIQTSSRLLAMATAMSWAQRAEDTRVVTGGPAGAPSSALLLPFLLEPDMEDGDWGGGCGKTNHTIRGRWGTAATQALFFYV